MFRVSECQMIGMESFGNYRSDDAKCQGCWLRDCCKFIRNEREEALLRKIKNKALIIRHFDGNRLSERKVGYDKSLNDFLEAPLIGD